ncbi:MAG: VWA domain-containing protein [Acidobacteria bacterium]|nr:VWA domain-containing protein [Acidobacteriota bacterium]
MDRYITAALLFSALTTVCVAQSGNVKTYSESVPTLERKTSESDKPRKTEKKTDDDETIRVETDLIIVPTQVTDRSGRALTNLRKGEFKIFENNVEQEIAYFAAEEQPFTVALLLDMSYSSVFKIADIQSAALSFINQLKPDDKVMIVAFDEKVRVLCKPTNNRYALKLAVEATRIGSGTSLYSAIDGVLRDYFSTIKGRKAVVLLSDGVDTTSQSFDARSVMRSISETEVIFYPIQYDTYEDVQKTRQNQAEIRYDEDDRPYAVIKPRVKGEREEDYRAANEFVEDIADRTGGRTFKVSSTTNLASAFKTVADELRRVYSLGYYPSGNREVGVRYAIKVRVYRPNLVVRARNGYELSADR